MLLTLILLSPLSSASAAATWVVNTLDDTSSGSCTTTCSLRDALGAAASDDTITFQSGLSGTITLGSTLVMTTDVTIVGPGAASLEINGFYNSTVFTVNSGAVVTISGLTIRAGSAHVVGPADGHSGGGIKNYGTLTLNNVTLSDNIAQTEGGAIYNAGTLTVTDSTFSDNLASYVTGGAIHNTAGATLTVVNSHFSGNRAPHNLAAMPNNGDGGGIWNAGTLILSDSTFVNNSADWFGGAIHNLGTATVSSTTFSGNWALYGGAISSTGSMTLTTSTLADNAAIPRSPIRAFGGGVYNGGSMTISNSTLQGNIAGPVGGSSITASGGGIANFSLLTIFNSTVSQNQSSNGGGISNQSGGTLNLGSNIIAGNSSAAGSDLEASVASLGNNLIGNTAFTAGFIDSDLQNVNPLLNALADNGGATQTMSVQAASPAIGKGNCNLGAPAAPVSTDQIGNARLSRCTIGAYEFPPTVPAITSADSTLFALNMVSSFTMTTTGLPAPTLSLTGELPSGITFVDNGDGTATLAGTTDSAGIYPLTLTADNGFESDAVQTFTLYAGNAPAITSADSVVFAPNTASSFTVTTTGAPVAALSQTGALPGGIAFVDNGDGTATLAGTTASAGVYVLTFTAQNGIGSEAVQSFSLYVGQVAAITSANSVSFPTNTASSFTVTTTGDPIPTLSQTGALPGGITFRDNGDGSATLAGTTASPGVYPLTLAANNGIEDDAVQDFTLSIGQAAAITSADSARFAVNTASSFTVTATGDPLPSLSQTGTLPAGITFVDNGDGTATLEGVTNSAGSYSLTVTAHNGAGPDVVQNFRLVVYTLVVGNTNDSGPESLREVLANAPAGSTITFDPSLNGGVIRLLTDTLVLRQDVAIQGPGASLLAVDGNDTFSVFQIGAGVNVTISGLTIQHGRSPFGAGIGNGGVLTVSNSTISGNSGDAAAGIFNRGTLTIRDSSVSGNAAVASVGGIWNAGTLIVSNSTVAGNTASQLAGGLANQGTMAVNNSTIALNTSAEGSGIYRAGGTLTVTNSIVAGNTGSANCATGSPDTLIDNGYNLEDGTSCGFGGATGANTDPLFDVAGLANNGGSTQTIALQAISPAINAGDPAFAGPPAFDQRGAPYGRISGGQVDIGAYEAQLLHLVFSTQPSNTSANAIISPPVTVEIKDALGNPTSSSANVTLAIGANPGGGTLSGTLSVAAVGGVATFSDLSIDQIGTGYTLMASATGLTGDTSASFDINAPVQIATHLAFVQQPATTAAGATINPPVTIVVRDASNTLVSSDHTTQVTLALGSNPGGGTLSGTLTATAVSGVAIFSDLSIDQVGTGYALTASATGLTGDTSSAFDITATPQLATQLIFLQQPTDALAGMPITPAITVQIADASNVPVSGDHTTQVTLALGSNPGSGTLGGTLTATAVNGVATFSDLSIDQVGTGYTLTASATGLIGDTSASFDISAPVQIATHLVFVQQPATTAAGATINPPVTVVVRDAGNAIVSGDDATQVTLAIDANPAGGTLSGTLTTTAVSGVAIFSDLSIDQAGTGYTLTASAAGLTGDTSSAFDITATPQIATQLVFLQQPTDTVAGGSITPAVTVQIEDASNGVVSADHTTQVALAIGANPGSGTLSGTLTVTAINGVATFSDLSIDQAGTGYTLVASSTPGLTAATSAAFNITAIPVGGTISIAKQFGDQHIDTARGTSLSFTLSNPTGNPALTGLAFTDTLPIGLVFEGAPATAQCGGTVSLNSDQVLTFRDGSLAAGPSSCTIVSNVKADGTISGQVTNQTSILTADGGFASASGASASLTIGATSTPIPPTTIPPTTIPPTTIPPTAIPAELSELSHLAQLTQGEMRGHGGHGGVRSGNATGNVYVHVIARDGNFVASPAEIGVESVLNLGVVQAVDVFGALPGGATVLPFDAPVQVCLRGTGEVLFLNAADAQRTVERLGIVQQGEFLCVTLSSAGTLVLVSGTSGLPDPSPVPAGAPEPSSGTTLENCQVTTNNAPINLRAEPGMNGAVLATLPHGISLTAVVHVPGWYRVIYLDGQGWVSDAYLDLTGGCGQ